jgi:hypothetical protein
MMRLPLVRSPADGGTHEVPINRRGRHNIGGLSIQADLQQLKVAAVYPEKVVVKLTKLAGAGVKPLFI